MKLKAFPLIVLLSLLAAQVAWAGGSCVPSYLGSRLHLECTTSATDGSLSYTLPDNVQRLLGGSYGYIVVAYPTAEGTAPDDTCALAITDARGLVLLSATGNGAALINATGTLPAYMEGPNGSHYHRLHYDLPLTFAVTGNEVTEANISIDLDLSRETGY